MQRLSDVEARANGGGWASLPPPDEFDVSLAVSAMAWMVERIKAGNGYTLCYSPLMYFFQTRMTSLDDECLPLCEVLRCVGVQWSARAVSVGFAIRLQGIAT